MDMMTHEKPQRTPAPTRTIHNYDWWVKQRAEAHARLRAMLETLGLNDTQCAQVFTVVRAYGWAQRNLGILEERSRIRSELVSTSSNRYDLPLLAQLQEHRAWHVD